MHRFSQILVLGAAHAFSVSAASAYAVEAASAAPTAATPAELLPPAEYVALRLLEPLPLPENSAGLTLEQVEAMALASNPTLA